ncbi:MAG: hypothetical protein ACTSU5_14565 [Promethearchaeota archaeon]
MPIGIVLIKWDNEIGPVLIQAHPDTLKVTNNLLTQIYSAHRYSSLAPGFSSLTLKNKKVVSFFSGMGDTVIGVPNYVVALLIRRDERVAAFREILKKAAAEILGNLENGKYKKIIPKIYKELSRVS